MAVNFTPSKEDLGKNVTLGTLLEYTDEFLIPKMAEMMDEKIGILDKRMDGLDKRMDGLDKRMDGLDKKIDQRVGQLRSDLIDHVDRTINNAKAEIITAINKRHEQYRMAFEKIMAILQRSNLAAVEEVKAVYELIT